MSLIDEMCPKHTHNSVKTDTTKRQNSVNVHERNESKDFNYWTELTRSEIDGPTHTSLLLFKESLRRFLLVVRVQQQFLSANEHYKKHKHINLRNMNVRMSSRIKKKIKKKEKTSMGYLTSNPVPSQSFLISLFVWFSLCWCRISPSYRSWMRLAENSKNRVVNLWKNKVKFTLSYTLKKPLEIRKSLSRKWVCFLLDDRVWSCPLTL